MQEGNEKNEENKIGEIHTEEKNNQGDNDKEKKKEVKKILFIPDEDEENIADDEIWRRLYSRPNETIKKDSFDLSRILLYSLMFMSLMIMIQIFTRSGNSLLANLIYEFESMTSATIYMLILLAIILGVVLKKLSKTLSLKDFEDPKNILMKHRISKVEKQIIDLNRLKKSIKKEDIENHHLFSKISESRKMMEGLEKEIIQLKENTLYSNLNKHSEIMVNRLRTEIFGLSRRANANLLIGSFIAVIGMIILGFVIIAKPGSQISSDNLVLQLLLSMLPKISIVIFVEIFAFFFLKLYKENLKEIKYYQNELTNIETKNLILHLGSSMNDKEILDKVTLNFLDIERNFILKKDETTVEIEKQKLDKVEYKELLESISKIIGKK